jgi:hypothetical protein
MHDTMDELIEFGQIVALQLVLNIGWLSWLEYL